MHDGDRSGPVQLSILLSSLPCALTAKVRGVHLCVQCAEALPSLSVTAHVLTMHVLPCRAVPKAPGRLPPGQVLLC